MTMGIILYSVAVVSILTAACIQMAKIKGKHKLEISKSGYKYMKERCRKNDPHIINLACCYRKSGCRGRALYDSKLMKFKETAPHMCPKVNNLADTVKFHQVLMKAAKNDSTSGKKTHMKLKISNPELASHIPYAKKKNTFQVNKKKYNPIVELGPVKSIDELADRLTEHPEALAYTLNFQNDEKEDRSMEWIKVTDSRGYKNLLIFDRKFVTRNITCDQWFVDATFSPRPKFCGYQLLTIEFGKSDKAVPGIWCLMERKFEISYIAILKEIQQQFKDLKPIKVMLDYERGMHNAFQKVFPEAKLNGCYFHFTKAAYSQALKKKAAQKQNKTKNATRHAVLKKFLCLPLLPAHRINEAFEIVRREAQQPEYGIYFKAYISYFQKEWVQKWSCGRISVYGLINKTNNLIESYHKIIADLFGKRPTASNFIDKLTKLQIGAWSDFWAISAGRSPTAKTLPKWKEKQQKMSEVLRKLDEDNDLAQAIDSLAELVDYQREMDDADYESDYEDAEDQEEY